MQLINNRYKIENNYVDYENTTIFKVNDLWNENKILLLKLFRNESQNIGFTQKFAKNFLDLSNIKHKNIMSNHNFDRVSSIDSKLVKKNYFFYTKEYIDGVKLTDLFDKLTLEEILDIVIQLIEVVEYLEFRGYVYQYVTPENIFVIKNDSNIVVKLVDLAEIIEKKATDSCNDSFSFYLAPEVRLKCENSNKTSDLYSIAMVFYSLLCHMHKEYLPNHFDINCSNISSFLNQKLSALLEKMTNKESKLRFSSSVDIINEINNIFNTKYELNVKEDRNRLNFNTKIVGRNKEIEFINDIDIKFENRYFDNNLVIITGEEGIGKTRLLKEIAYELRLKGRTIYSTIVSESTSKELDPIIKILRLMIQNCDANLIDKYGQELVKILPEITSIKDIKPSPMLSGNRERLRLYDRISNFIVDSINNIPTYIMIDDFYNSDFETINLINYIINNNKSCPLLFILTCNKNIMKTRRKFESIIDEWLEIGGVDELKLLRFNFEENSEMIKNILGIGYAPINFSTRVIDDTLGNPRHIEEALKSLHATGEIFINDNGNWDTKTQVYTKIQIPASIDEALKGQLKSLDKDLLGIAKYISIFNTSVSKAIIGKLVNSNSIDVNEKVDKLVSMKILEERVEDWGYTYDFYNKQLKRYVYQSIDEYKRNILHKFAADILEDVYLKQNRGNTDELIYHYNLSNQIDKAIKQSITTAKKMKGLVGNLQLISLWENAVILINNRKDIDIDKDLDIDKLDVLVNLGNICMSQGMNGKALDCYEEGLVYSQKYNEFKYIVICTIGIADLFYRRKDIETAQKYVLDAKKIAKKYDYIEGTLESVRMLNRINIAKGEYYDVIKMSEQYLPMALEGELFFYVAHFYNHIGISYAFTDQIEQSIDFFVRSKNYFLKSGDFIEATRAINNLGATYSDYFSDTSKAMEYYQQGLDICQRYQSLESESNFLINIAELYAKDDEFEKAKKYAEKAEILTLEIEDASLLFLIQVNLANIYLNLGEYDKCYKYYQSVKAEYEETFIEEQHISRYHDFLVGFYYNFGMYKESLEHAIKTKEKSMSLDKKLILRTDSIIIILKYMIEGKLDKEEIGVICSKYREFNGNGDRRKHLLMSAFVSLQAGEINFVNELLDEDKEVSLLFSTPYLEVLREYIICSINKNKEGLLELANMLKVFHFCGLEYYVYVSLGDNYFEKKEYYNAVNFYLEGLDLLYGLVKKIPNKVLQVSYIKKYSGYRVKNKINIIMSTFKGQNICDSREVNFNVDMKLEDYFDFTDIMELFSEEIFSFGNNNKSNSKISGINNVEELISCFTNNYKDNLEMILSFIIQRAVADRGIIFIYNDDLDKLETLISTTDNDSAQEKIQILSETKWHSKGLLINRSFKQDNDSMFMLLHDDVKALMCIPILKLQNDKASLPEVDRRRDENFLLYDDIVGYLYIDTDKLFNRFDDKRFKLIQTLSYLIFLNIDNYNLKVSSSIDKMTGAYTRKYFDMVFKEILNKAIKEDSYFTVIMSDIDKFKNVNDTFGHQKGDGVLSRLGKIILDNIRKTDIVGRYGGEEFIIILPITSIEDGKIVAEKIRQKIEDAVLISEECPLTISMGLSMFPHHGQSVEELIEKADQALYRAKENGRNNSAIWSNNIGNSRKRLDKLAGIISGNTVSDQRNTLAMVEIINLLGESLSKEDKIYRFLGRIIEIIEGKQGILFTVNDEEIDKIYARQRFLDTWIEQPRYNKNTILKAIADKNGEFSIDWEDIGDIDSVTGKPNWQSLIVVPLIFNGIAKGILQISVPIKEKEFDYNSYNFVNTIGEVIAAMI